jgi:hypothetical protein
MLTVIISIAIAAVVIIYARKFVKANDQQSMILEEPVIQQIPEPEVVQEPIPVLEPTIAKPVENKKRKYNKKKGPKKMDAKKA